VREDARNEIISREKAEKLYGVVLVGEEYSIDAEKTRALRAAT
jgi:N-methylhydantoinase B/oxoprolinase/acetone carboxylase alpha subunit